MTDPTSPTDPWIRVERQGFPPYPTKHGNPKATTLVVCYSAIGLERAREAFNGVLDAFFCLYGEGLQGRRFERIILIDKYIAYERNPSHITRWLNEIRCRLTKDGQWHELN